MKLNLNSYEQKEDGMKTKWNLGDGLGNVCWSALDKLNDTSYQFEMLERKKALINLDSYEVMALISAMSDYIEKHGLKRENPS